MTDIVAGNAAKSAASGYVGPAITAGAGVIGTLLTNRANRKEAERAREWQEEMWNKQNEYNLPVNQVARLKEAGINPNLAFGSAASAMSSSFPSSPARATYDYDLGSAARSYFQTKFEREQVMSQVRERNAEARNKELQNDAFAALLNDYIDSKRWGYKADAAKGRWFTTYNDEWFGSDLQGKRFKNDLLKVEKDLVGARYKRAMQDLKHLKAKYSFEDNYYNNNLNPYETSTIAGLVRTIGGVSNNLLGLNWKGLGKYIWQDLTSFPKRWKDYWKNR